jgi:two-component system LytT family response regulator
LPILPIDIHEFDQAMDKFLTGTNGSADTGQQRYVNLRDHLNSDSALPKKLTIPTAEGYFFLETKSILYCHADSNYTEFYLSGNQKILSSHTLGYYEELLAGQPFFRVHRSYLINLTHVASYRKSEGGSVVMSDGREIEISRGNKDALLKLLK